MRRSSKINLTQTYNYMYVFFKSKVQSFTFLPQIWIWLFTSPKFKLTNENEFSIILELWVSDIPFLLFPKVDLFLLATLWNFISVVRRPWRFLTDHSERWTERPSKRKKKKNKKKLVWPFVPHGCRLESWDQMGRQWLVGKLGGKVSPYGFL